MGKQLTPLEERIVQAREFCVPYLGEFVCREVLSGNEVLTLKNLITYHQGLVIERDAEIERLREVVKQSEMGGAFYYLAQPYTSPIRSVMLDRVLEGARLTAELLKQGYHIYAPIIHNHEMAELFELPKDEVYWKADNEIFLRAAKGVIVAKIDGWETSKGVAREMKYSISLPYHEEIKFLNPVTLELE